MVRDDRVRRAVLEQVVVPARPRAPALREQARVGVEHGLVAAVRDRAQQLVLAVAGVGEQRQRLVGMGGEDDLVEPLRLTAGGRDGHAVRMALDRAHRRGEPQPHAPVARDRVDVARRAAGDGAPARPPAEAEHAVVVEELGEEARREAPHLVRVGGPDRGRPAARSAARRTPARSAGARASGRATTSSPDATSARAARLKRTSSASIRWKRGATRCARPREQPARRRAVVLEAARAVADREAHVRRLRGDPEPVEQPLEPRVVAVVEHDEAGVDVVGRVLGVDPDRVRVAAGERVRLEHA